MSFQPTANGQQLMMAASSGTAASAAGFRSAQSGIACRTRWAGRMNRSWYAQFPPNGRTSAGRAFFRLRIAADQFFKIFFTLIANVFVNGHKMKLLFHEIFNYIIARNEKMKRTFRNFSKILLNFPKKGNSPCLKFICRVR